MNPRQDYMCRHVADDMGVVHGGGNADIGGPTIGFNVGVRGNIGGDVAMQAIGRIVGDGGEAYAAGSVASDFDGAGEQQFADVATPLATCHGLVLGTVGDRGFVDFHQSTQRVAIWIDHGVAELGTSANCCSAAVEAENEFIEITTQVFGAQAMVNAHGPAFEV